ncbi:MAG: AN1-type zinc finger domain-containing protein [Nitrososphaerota archaeon]
MRCSRCGAEEVLPFKCAYCGDYFCSKHRLPETHECKALYLARNIVEIERRESRPSGSSSRHATMLAVKTEMIFSRLTAMERGSEVLHLAAGSCIVAGVAFSMIYSLAAWMGASLIAIVVASVVASFLAHELAHKIEAMRQGHWARFRLNLFGSIISLLSILLPIKFLAPGAVVIFGQVTQRGVARVAAAGPIVNLVVAAILLPFIYISYALLGLLDATFSNALLLIGHLNILMGLINLIPLGPLDGLKIITTSFRAWASYMSVAIILYIVYHFRLPILV